MDQDKNQAAYDSDKVTIVGTITNSQLCIMTCIAIFVIAMGLLAALAIVNSLMRLA